MSSSALFAGSLGQAWSHIDPCSQDALPHGAGRPLELGSDENLVYIWCVGSFAVNWEFGLISVMSD
jgi:hypothetical protein